MDAFEVALAPLIITVIMLAAVVHSIFKEVKHADVRTMLTINRYCWLFIDRVSHRPEER